MSRKVPYTHCVRKPYIFTLIQNILSTHKKPNPLLVIVPADCNYNGSLVIDVHNFKHEVMRFMVQTLTCI